MPLEYVKEDVALLKEHIKDLTDDSDEFLEKFNEIWYFIVATVVLTSIGIISVLSWTV